VFAVAGTLLGRHDEAVGEDVVDVIGAGGAGMAEPACLGRCRPPRQDARVAVVGETRQIDDDTDLQLANELRRLEIALPLDIDETVERTFEAGSHLAPVVGAQGYGGSRKPRAIVALDQARQQTGSRALAEIR
jgi:hypothetical protein